MEARNDDVLLTLKKSGLISIIGIVGAFRGVQGLRFKGIWRKLYWCYEIWSDASVIINIITIFAKMVLPGVRMSVRCMSGFPLVSCVLCLFMSLYPRIRSSEFLSLLARYDEAFEDTPFPKHIEKEIATQASTVRRMTTVLVTLEFYPMFTMSVILPVLNEITNFTFGPRKLSVPSLFPFDPLASFINYLPTLILHASGSVFVNLKKIGFEETFFIFASRQITLFKHLRHNLEIIFDSLEVNEDGSINDEATRLNPVWRKRNIERPLTHWVKHHQKCLLALKHLENLYSWPLAIYFTLTGLILCAAAYVTSDELVEPETLIICSAFAFGNVLELLFICRMGDLITFEMNELNHALAGKHTFLLNRREHSSLKMILTRCRKERVILAVGIFPLSLDTFKSVITTSYSYFTMLKIVNGEDSKGN